MAAVAFALGAVTMLLGLIAFSVPGKVIRSLRQENQLLRDLVKTLEDERTEVRSIIQHHGDE